MNMRKPDVSNVDFVLCVAIFCILILLSSSASAKSAEMSVSFRPENASYDSSEFRFGSLFDRDSGFLTGVALTGSYSRNGWRISLLQRSLYGLIDYQGHNQVFLPIQSKTNLSYSQLGLSVTYQFSNVPVYAGLAWRTRKIDRHIQATAITQALHETLRQREWGPVIGLTWHFTDTLYIDARLMALATTSSTLSVDFLGSYDPGELSMPQNWDHVIDVNLIEKLSVNASLLFGMSRQSFNPSASGYLPFTRNGIPVGGGIYNYPGSTQELSIYRVGLTIYW